MISKLINYLRRKDTCRKSGIIRLKVDLSVENSLSFRVDGTNMLVEWGDGVVSEQMQMTGQFTHQYAVGEECDIVVRGEDITAIDMPRCQCISLGVTGCETLEFINCSDNRLSELNVSYCKELYELHCAYNELESLDIENSLKLFYIDCASNRLRAIDVKGCRNLVNLYCSKNRIHTLNLSDCRKLVIVKAEENAFDEISLLDCISTLKHKFNGTPGLLGINGMLSGTTDRVKVSIAEKGWCEI